MLLVERYLPHVLLADECWNSRKCAVHRFVLLFAQSARSIMLLKLALAPYRYASIFFTAAWELHVKPELQLFDFDKR